VIASVSSDEAEDAPGGGDGNTTNDIVIANCKSVQLRAERDSNFNGRVYTIVLQGHGRCRQRGHCFADCNCTAEPSGGGAILGPGPGYTVTGALPIEVITT